MVRAYFGIIIPGNSMHDGVLAQLVEQRTLNPFVASSILARPTNQIKGL